ncbi:hypothetical protein BRARA_D01915 [Brassica rapa]|uniref:Uncharacterized protein n=1 Tax=Brassica campestris TaxID=3711 RepID=A0A397ZTS1_BRACM|nr:uncharacterized protein LOC106450077 [Brassica napus]RID66800.1 hypothetical protein BRARA_D01915 [Brassica rapa]
MMRRQLVLVIILVVIFVVVLDVTQVEATRSFPMAVDEISLLLQVLQRGPVRGSGRNGCTHIPRGGSGRCRHG